MIISEYLNPKRDVEARYVSGADGLEGPHLAIHARGHEVDLFGSEVDNLRRMLMGAANREDRARVPVTVDRDVAVMAFQARANAIRENLDLFEGEPNR